MPTARAAVLVGCGTQRTLSRDQSQFTETLLAGSRGDPRAADELLPLVYDRLRALAGSYMRGERAGHTLQPTALVHEAYLRLVEVERIDWQGKTHFFAMAARQMRRVLVDHARSVSAAKRGDRALRITLDDEAAVVRDQPLEMLALDEALAKLADASPRQSQVAEMRLFAGMQVKEVAHALQVSERTVKSDWRFARVWLMRELGFAVPDDDD